MEPKDPLQPYEWLNYDEWAGLSTEERETMSAHNSKIEKAADALAKMGWSEGRWKKKSKSSDTPAQRYLTAVKEKRKKWEPNTRSKKHDRTMVTRAQEDAESDEFGDEVILLTKSYRDAVCLMTTCSYHSP